MQMQIEIPYDDVHSLQISLRNHANLSHYNPDSTSLPKLPSFNDSISHIDPSPDYLRCKHCKGRLLRGVKSMICVFCGKQPDVGPHPIKFMDTIGSQWFLHSLGLNGSEVVDVSIRENESKRGLNAARNEIPLSHLLDLEIVWPAESEENEATTLEMTPVQRLTTLNFDGADLDNFFPQGKFGSVPASSEQQPEVNKFSSIPRGDASENVGNVDLSLFENVQPSDTIGTAKVNESGGNFSGWDAEFQSAGSGVQRAESKPSDPFVGSSSVDLSAHLDSVFGSSKRLSDENTQENSINVSNTDDWFQGDIWSGPNPGTSDQQFKVPTNDNNQFQITSSSTKSAEDKTTDEDDSFDVWNDFASPSVQVPSKDNSKTDVISTPPQVDESSDLNFLGGSSDSQNVDFGSFSQTDFFSGPFSNQNVSTRVNTLQSETSISNRVVGIDSSNGVVDTEEIHKVGDVSDGNAVSKADDAEILMSQMHDLSFMLENNLSIPQNVDQKKNDPFGSF